MSVVVAPPQPVAQFSITRQFEWRPITQFGLISCNTVVVAERRYFLFRERADDDDRGGGVAGLVGDRDHNPFLHPLLRPRISLAHARVLGSSH